jgi:hypothetical protein
MIPINGCVFNAVRYRSDRITKQPISFAAPLIVSQERKVDPYVIHQLSATHLTHDPLSTMMCTACGAHVTQSIVRLQTKNLGNKQKNRYRGIAIFTKTDTEN